MNNICYKLVGVKTEEKNGSRIFISSSANEDISLTYKLKSKTTPIIPKSKIFVFKNLNDAILHREDFLEVKTVFILKCKCGELKLRKKNILSPYAGFSYVVNYWTKNLVRCYNFKPIKGTYLTDWVIPIEIIY